MATETHRCGGKRVSQGVVAGSPKTGSMASESSDVTRFRAVCVRQPPQSIDLSCEESADDLGTYDSPCWQSEQMRFGMADSPGSARITFEEIIAHAGKHNEQELRAMLAIERELQPPPDYITTAGAIGPEHRHFLISWMTMAAEYHHFGFYTSALAVNLLDRFMAAQPTSDEELWTLQLAAVACLSIAAKMEEGIMPADIADLQVAAPWERPFEARFIKNMELVVLARLQWHVTAITAVSFLDRLLYGAARCASLLKEDALLHRMRHRAGLLVTKCLPEERYLAFHPSSMAAAAIVLLTTSFCSDMGLEAMQDYMRALNIEYMECKESLMEDMAQGLRSLTSSPSREGACGKAGHVPDGSNPTPTSVLQLEDALIGPLPSLRDSWH